MFRYGGRHLLPRKTTTEGLSPQHEFTGLVLEETASRAQKAFASFGCSVAVSTQCPFITLVSSGPEGIVMVSTVCPSVCMYVHTTMLTFHRPQYFMHFFHDIDGLVQNCGNSSTLALELLQFCAKPLTTSAVFKTKIFS